MTKTVVKTAVLPVPDVARTEFCKYFNLPTANRFCDVLDPLLGEPQTAQTVVIAVLSLLEDMFGNSMQEMMSDAAADIVDALLLHDLRNEDVRDQALDLLAFHFRYLRSRT